jgi:hypothetical protein
MKRQIQSFLLLMSNFHDHVLFFSRLEHAKLHAKHKGHETMHLEMILILLTTLVVAQILLVQWKKRHFGSYQV